MTHTQILSTRIANLESLVSGLPGLRQAATDLQAELASLNARAAEVDSLIRDGERAARTLSHLSEVADRVLNAGVVMEGEGEAAAPGPVVVTPVPAEDVPDPVPAEDVPVEEGASEEPDVEDPESAEPLDAEEVPAEAPTLPVLEEDAEDEDEADGETGDVTSEPTDAGVPVLELTPESLTAYLAAHPGSLPSDIAAHFSVSKMKLGTTLSFLRRQKKAECLLSNPPRWYLMADLPQGEQRTSPAPAAPLPELPPEPQQAAQEIPDVSDDDLNLLVAFLQLRGNQTHRQVHAEFRYSHNWTMQDVEQLVAAGMARGVLSAVGGIGTRSRIGIARRGAAVAS